jgi:hypothetical protein
MSRLPLMIGAVLAACAPTHPGPSAGIPVTGQWGGTHIGLMLTDVGGTIEYDCASGRLVEALIPGPGGTFEVDGLHTPGHGGPAIEGEILPTYRARFTGTVRDDRMTLTGRVENGVLLGPFALRRGAEAGIFRCL